MLGSVRAVLLATLIPSLVVGDVAAQPAPAPAAPTPAQQKQANLLVKQAIDKNGEGKFLEAVDLYLNAYALVPLALLLSNIGTNYQQAGARPEALKYFCMFLERETDTSGVNYQYGKAQAKALQIELGNTTVTDDNVCAPLPPPPTIDPSPSPPPVDRGGATASGGGGKTLRLAGLGIAGAGVVTLGVGVVFGLKALSITNEINGHDMTDPWTNIDQLEKDGQRYEDLQIKLMIAGGVIAVAGGVLYMVGRAKGKSSAEKQLAVRPSVAPGNVGFVVGGSF